MVVVVLAVRTYAVWKRDKRVGIGLALLLGLSQIPDMILLNRFIQGIGCEYFVHPLFFSVLRCLRALNPSVLVAQNPYPEIFRGCFFTKATRLAFAIWVTITIVEGGTLSTI